MRSLDDQLQAERQREESISGLSRLFKGRSTPDRLSGIGERLNTAREEERALLQELESVENEQPPDTPGLSVQEKRSVNYMIIAFAQHLYLQFSDRNLVSMVKESGESRAGAINYGNKPDCDALLGRISRHVESMEAASDYADVLKRRAELIAEHAVFVEDDDAVPIAGTVATVFAIGADGGITKSDANLVGDDYWGITGVLSR